jgi:hypothetical protein
MKRSLLALVEGRLSPLKSSSVRPRIDRARRRDMATPACGCGHIAASSAVEARADRGRFQQGKPAFHEAEQRALHRGCPRHRQRPPRRRARRAAPPRARLAMWPRRAPACGCGHIAASSAVEARADRGRFQQGKPAFHEAEQRALHRGCPRHRRHRPRGSLPANCAKTIPNFVPGQTHGQTAGTDLSDGYHLGCS